MSTPQLRLARPADLEPLVALEARSMHFPMGHRVREWFTCHPLMTLDRIAVAEDGGNLVAAAALVPEPYLFRGIPIDTGVWDAVATEETHRHQGLCRALLAFLEQHHRPTLLLVEGATSVYRRLGYLPAFPNRGGCNSGGALLRISDLPSPNAWSVRMASPDDAPWLASLRQSVAQNSLLAPAPDESAWRHALREDRTVVGPEGTTLNRWQEVRILLDPSGQPVGFFVHDPWDMGLLMEMELLLGQNYREAGVAAFHSLSAFSGAAELKIALPAEHPLLAAFPLLLARRDRGGSDWHARIPNFCNFFNAVRPALESVLSCSPLAGWTGEILISCGRECIHLCGNAGTLTFSASESLEVDVRLTEAASIRLIFGQASFVQLLSEDRDIGGSDDAIAVIDALFPSGRVFARSI